MDKINSAIVPRLDITKKISTLEWLLLVSILIFGPILALLLVFLNTIYLMYSTINYFLCYSKIKTSNNLISEL